MMQIEWVNHAGFIIRHRDVALMIDPWLDGRVFDQSWAHISPTTFRYDEFARITHIWFSHEHPDHFFPPNLKRIAPEHRAKIRVLFQHTIDQRVVGACRSLGFPVTELMKDWYQVAPGLDVLCHPRGGDSWAAFRTADHTLLNLNDCIYFTEEDLLPIKNNVGPIDTLVTQFSYAAWEADRDDPEAWRAVAQDQLEKVRREINVFQPRQVLLGASFVYFCHAENWYMNQWVNQASDAFEYVSRHGTAPVVLYPGDTWQAGTAHDSTSALDRYRQDFANALARGPLTTSTPVSLDELHAAGRNFIDRLLARNSRLLLWRIPPSYAFITDHNLVMRLSTRGLELADGEQQADVELAAGALLYCLKHDWGGETLHITGRFRVPQGGDRRRFFRWLSIASANSHGQKYDLRYYAAKLRRPWNIPSRILANGWWIRRA